ncbi:holin [Skermania piniformis]|uniref:Holin n=1 Tax=Skermania pinensis TaxID=39122 RepID=A0ABX8SAM3_9ACTN|nr:holin [Skermania piniformis]QXQ14833.1 holin [Skermania piniformis]
MTLSTYWWDVLERAAMTGCQAVLAAAGTDAAGITDLDARAIASVAALAVILSAVKSVALRGFGRTETASLVPTIGEVPPR